MVDSIAVFGAGPALGRSVALRFAREGFDIVLVARRAEGLAALADEVRGHGVSAHVIAADLSDTGRVPQLAEQVRHAVGELECLYYGAAADGFMAAADLTPARTQDLMPLGLYTPLALVQAFLPGMLARHGGAILTAQGASAVHGMPNIAGGCVLAAQRNYLQALHIEVSDQGVYVGGLYIGAVIEYSAFHAQREAAIAAGAPVPQLSIVDPALLADTLWTMHHTRGPAEMTYPEPLFNPNGSNA